MTPSSSLNVSPAVRFDNHRRSATPVARKSRAKRRRQVHYGWRELSFADIRLTAFATPPRDISRRQSALLFGAAVLLHVSLLWLLPPQGQSPASAAKHELHVEFVKPLPKVEPPKPRPVTATPARREQAPPLLPTIEQPQAPDVASPANVEAVAAAPEPALEPVPEPTISAPIGRVGYRNNPPPNYPPLAVKQHWQGTVLLRVHVLGNGTVDAVEVLESSGRKVLDDEAMRTVRSWLFAPAKRGDTAIDGWAEVPIEFLLD